MLVVEDDLYPLQDRADPRARWFAVETVVMVRAIGSSRPRLFGCRPRHDDAALGRSGSSTSSPSPESRCARHRSEAGAGLDRGGFRRGAYGWIQSFDIHICWSAPGVLDSKRVKLLLAVGCERPCADTVCRPSSRVSVLWNPQPPRAGTKEDRRVDLETTPRE